MEASPKFSWSDKTVLVTGGTGSFGRRFLHTMRANYRLRRLIVLSRDEQKQHELREYYGGDNLFRYIIGDVRNRERLTGAFHGVDVVVHAAAMKQIPTCENNTWEAMLTNVIGARNVVQAGVDAGVERVMNLSTDKAVNPVSVYGATKLLAEKIFAEAATAREGRPPRFSTVRYGNVLGTRGSVVPMFVRQRASGVVTVTDPRMTRFWITRDEGVNFVIQCIEGMEGGEVFVPKAPSAGVMDLVETIAPSCRVDYIGIRDGEKLHEVLLERDEARRALELDDMFVIWPNQTPVAGEPRPGRRLPEDFQYTSDGTARRLTREELLERLVQAGDLRDN